jgi:hypothetical protein
VNRACRRIVAVSGEQHRPELMNAVLADGAGCDVVYVESIERGYSRIKQIVPDSIVVFVGVDDVPACQLLAMLKLDRETCAIPLLACMHRRTPTELDDVAAERNREPDQSSPHRA